MKARRWIGFAAAGLLVLSSLAHAFLGWPPFRGALLAADLDPQIVRALGAGWHFGSVAMLTFGVIVLLAAWKPSETSARLVRPIALAYLFFGLGAFLARDFNPHFLLFAFTGALLAGFAFYRRG